MSLIIPNFVVGLNFIPMEKDRHRRVLRKAAARSVCLRKPTLPARRMLGGSREPVIQEAGPRSKGKVRRAWAQRERKAWAEAGGSLVWTQGDSWCTAAGRSG